MNKEEVLRPIASEVSRLFSDGDLISHEWLKKKFCIKKLDANDFESSDDFLEAVKLQQFEYMSLVENLRDMLIQDFNVCIKNVVGEGYSIIPPKEQTKYGFDLLTKEISKTFRDCNKIMNNVRNVTFDQQSKDNDLRAKAAMMAMLFKQYK